MLGNFGERPGLFGRLPAAATAPPLALASSVPGTMVGTGMTPEGINTNPIVYNLYAVMCWRGAAAPDLDVWVQQYYRRRYGLSLKGSGGGRGATEAAAARAWGLLQRSVYSAPTMISGEQGATASDMAARPALSGGRIPDTIDTPFYNTSDVEQAWSELVSCGPELGDSVNGFAYDLVAVGRQVLSDRFNVVRASFAQAVGRLGRGDHTDAYASTWHCVHFSGADDAKCKGLTGAKLLACQTKICVSKGGNFSHDAEHNAGFPGCGTCWCCAAGAGPAPGPPAPPPAPADPAAAK
jgi:hypothetical protein